MRTLAALAFAALSCSLAGPAGADTGNEFTAHVANNWEQAKRAWSDGDWTLYLTGYTWHMPYAYDQQRREELNSEAWGGGLGRYVYDNNGNYHGLYAMVFSDSHYEPEYHIGYSWQHYWGSGELKAGLGYTVFVFGRDDVVHYVPIPAILPLASVRYARFELMGTFFPGFGSGKGNIAFFFGRLDF